ncbi:TlpA disulfide reductase family protein [Nakamurella sp. A5-74]|uniref:TlpA disulfide reductase family protein n=1 Tax=Nakamurella sp. A5-74 TaxID=3158264 RepID=A0AAU8DQA9_9ACTN
MIGNFRRVAAALLALACSLSACSSGTDVSVPQGGGFELVSPGGLSEFDYPAAQRKPLGEISGPTLTGDGRVSVADYPDKVVVLNFWGSWCTACRAEAPLLAAAARELASDGVQFVGVNVRESDRQNGADYDSVRGTPYPSIYDKQVQVLASIPGFPITGIPSTIVLDRQHRVAHVWIRAFASPSELQSVVKIVAAES